jgi:hypothetical protein
MSWDRAVVTVRSVLTARPGTYREDGGVCAKFLDVQASSVTRGTSARGQEVTRAPQPCQETPVEQMSDGMLARMRPDLGIGAALAPPGGNVLVAAARELGTHAPPGRQCRDGS